MPFRARGKSALPWALVAVLGPLAALAGAVSGSDAWVLLDDARTRLTASAPFEADFVQYYVPNGFSTGDSETGTLYLDMPGCLRWSYGEPFPKDFLLCGDWVYTWNPGEPSGRRYRLQGGETEGLELLRLETDRLRARYQADAETTAEGNTLVRLVPVDEAAEFQAASFVLARVDGTILSLEYEDRTGNRTAFEFSEAHALEAGAELFEVPDDLEWLED